MLIEVNHLILVKSICERIVLNNYLQWQILIVINYSSTEIYQVIHTVERFIGNYV